MGIFPSSVLAVAVAAPGEVEITDHDGNSLADHFRARPTVLPPSAVAVARAAWGLPTRPAGTPNRVRFVEEEAGLVAVFTEGE